MIETRNELLLLIYTKTRISLKFILINEKANVKRLRINLHDSVYMTV